MPINSWTVLAAAAVTCLATGLGAWPLAWRRVAGDWLGAASAVAGGSMLAASAVLAKNGGDYSWWETAAGAGAGVVFMLATHRLLAGRDLEVGQLQGADALKAVLIVAVMTVHSVSEGIGVGVSYGGGEALGLFITAAIAVHNIPEGLAISLVLVPRGTRVRTAAWWSVFSSLPQPLLAVPAFLFVESFRAALPVGLGFAAGAMTWMVLSELLPEARQQLSLQRLAGWLGAAFAVMLALQYLLS